MLPNDQCEPERLRGHHRSQSGGRGRALYSSFYGGSIDTVINGVAAFQGQIYATGWTGHRRT